MAVPIPKMTVEEYLALGRKAEYKSEYYRGAMLAMAGGTRKHSVLALCVARLIGNRLKGRGCELTTPT